MPRYTAPPHVSLHLPPGLSSFEDVCAESDATNSATDSEEEHTLTAFGDVSLTEEQMGSATNDIHRMNRLRLKVKRPPFPKKKRTSVQYSPKSPAGRLFDSSPAPSPLSPSLFFDALRNSLRSGKRRAAQCAQADAVDVETQPRTADSRESISSSSNDSYDYKPGQSVIVKEVSSVAEVPEPVKGWRKLPPRLPIPKWDVDN